MNIICKICIPVLIIFSTLQVIAQNKNIAARESEYYKIITLPVPEDILLEVGGLATLPDGRLALSTRRGDVWVVENPYMETGIPRFQLFASGLHEALGLLYHNNALFVAQRGELTKLVDKNGDGKADTYETVYAWPLSGHYHEYSYGPKMGPDGKMFVSGNVAFGDEEWWRGESRVPWRGWVLAINQDGTMEPWATGMRSPCGLGMIDGELFYTENQGDWMGSGGVWHLNKGDFTGHPAGLSWSGMPNSPVKLTPEEFYKEIDIKQTKKGGRFVKPENVPDEKNPIFLFNAKDNFPEIKLPAVWLPHGILGISNSEIIADETGGKFGPFEGQIFVGDQGQSKIMRLVMEKVNGEFQGVAFDFKAEFQSGVLRMNWGSDGSMFVGETNRGWGSAGPKDAGLERLVWTGKVPMEMKTVRSMPDGFEIEFTMPVNKATAENLNAYEGRSFTYKYHAVYGSPTINEEKLRIKGVKVSEDGMKVRLVVDNLRRHYIHEIHVSGIRSEVAELPVLHPVAYYTLNNIPEGAKLSLSEASTKRSAAPATSKPQGDTKLVVVTTAEKKKGAPEFSQIEPLLSKNTCLACHQVDKRQVGPAFTEIAKRKYSASKIVELIYTPQPQNWPDYATPMPPMPQVPKDEALKIAEWINSLQ
jgi:cytochrome c551/c552